VAGAQRTPSAVDQLRDPYTNTHQHADADSHSHANQYTNPHGYGRAHLDTYGEPPASVYAHNAPLTG
jgi:hypothetical protein